MREKNAGASQSHGRHCQLDHRTHPYATSPRQSRRRCRPQARRFNPASLLFGFGWRGKLLILAFRLMRFRCRRWSRPCKSGGPPLFAPFLEVEGDTGHIKTPGSILLWSRPRVRSMPLQAAPNAHRKRRLVPRPCGGNSRLAFCTFPRACPSGPHRSLLAQSQREQGPGFLPLWGGKWGQAGARSEVSYSCAADRRREQQRGRAQFVPALFEIDWWRSPRWPSFPDTRKLEAVRDTR
jgi:hypothetical protein